VLSVPDAVADVDVEWVADRVASQLAAAIASDDDWLLAEIVVDLMTAPWPTGDPPPEWWQPAVGRACAHSVGDTDHVDTVTHSVAAATLGLARSGIGRMVARGDLGGGVDGGVTVASVKRWPTR
jgi:hypothetical protein